MLMVIVSIIGTTCALVLVHTTGTDKTAPMIKKMMMMASYLSVLLLLLLLLLLLTMMMMQSITLDSTLARLSSVPVHNRFRPVYRESVDYHYREYKYVYDFGLVFNHFILMFFKAIIVYN
jgi:hypothetical protein